MTKEEAIEKMQKQKERYLEEWLDYSGVSKAYDMAIEALKRPDTMTAVLFDGMSGSKKIGLQPVKHGAKMDKE